MTATTTNALANSSSTYLRSAVHDPVQWHPWGPEAFDLAKAEGKPMLLDIGASWCQGSQVMARELYSAPDIAAVINERYVAIKVDRDERPDIDARHQAAVCSLNGQSGWPLTVFMTPDGKPFHGCVFVPGPGSGGKSAFLDLLMSTAETFHQHRQALEHDADQLLKTLSFNEAHLGGRDDLPPEIIEGIVSRAVSEFDRQNGGFGGAPKLPYAAILDLLIDRCVRTGDEQAASIVTTTLEKMASGGLCDQKNGGFHRASADGRWSAASPEKLAADNAALLRTYAYAWQVFRKPLFADVARGIMRWMDGCLCDRERGGFFASSTVHGGEEVVDRTLYAGWNALCISAYLQAVRALGDNDETAKAAERFALRSLDRLLTESWQEHKLDHVIAYAKGDSGHKQVAGTLEDYAYTVHACLDAYEATGELRYFELGRRIAVRIFQYFYHASVGGLFDTLGTCSALGALDVLRKPFHDTPASAGNPAAALALLRLHPLTGDDMFRDRAKTVLEAATKAMHECGAEAGTYGIAALWLLRASTQVVILGCGPEADALRQAAVGCLALNKAVLCMEASDLEGLSPALFVSLPESAKTDERRPLAMVRKDATWYPPVSAAADLTALMEDRRG